MSRARPSRTALRSPRRSAVALAVVLLAPACSSYEGWSAAPRPGDTGEYATATIPAAPYGAPQVETGVAIWDGDPSAVGMTAGHARFRPGSYARVTNTATGQSAIVQMTRQIQAVRGRDLELSRDAAAAIGALQQGRATVVIEPVATGPTTASEQRLWVRNDQYAAAPAPAPAASPWPDPAAARRAGVSYDPAIPTASIPTGPSSGVAMPSDVGARGYAAFDPRYLQIGSFRDRANAERMVDRLEAEGMADGAYGTAFVEPTYIDGALYHRVRLGPIEDSVTASRALQDATALGHSSARILKP